MDVPHIEDRDALYYPYIHIRDEYWLRSALIFFPHILRMVPGRYELSDSAFARELADTPGRRGEPLLGSYPLNSGETYRAGVRLAERFGRDIVEAGFREKYGRSATEAAFGDANVFQIHKDKFAAPLQRVLGDADLLWEATDHRGSQWVAVHPSVGETIMSTAALVAANARGCDVLTDSQVNHIVSSGPDEETIYASLLGSGTKAPTTTKPTASEIGNLVIATTFDLSTLTAADFAALSREWDALFDFRRVLAEQAAAIAPTADRRTRDNRAKEAAQLIVEQWEAKRRTWGRFLKRALALEAATEAKDTATNLLVTLSSASATAATGAAVAGPTAGVVLLATVPGLAVGLVYYGLKTWKDLSSEEQSASTRFLSHVAKHGGSLSASSRPTYLD